MWHSLADTKSLRIKQPSWPVWASDSRIFFSLGTIVSNAKESVVDYFRRWKWIFCPVPIACCVRARSEFHAKLKSSKWVDKKERKNALLSEKEGGKIILKYPTTKIWIVWSLWSHVFPSYPSSIYVYSKKKAPRQSLISFPFLRDKRADLEMIIPNIVGYIFLNFEGFIAVFFIRQWDR